MAQKRSKSRNKPLYSLFERRDGKLVRLSDMALPLDRARMHFQSALLAYGMGSALYPRELRRV